MKILKDEVITVHEQKLILFLFYWYGLVKMVLGFTIGILVIYLGWL